MKCISTSYIKCGQYDIFKVTILFLWYHFEWADISVRELRIVVICRRRKSAQFRVTKNQRKLRKRLKKFCTKHQKDLFFFLNLSLQCSGVFKWVNHAHFKNKQNRQCLEKLDYLVTLLVLQINLMGTVSEKNSKNLENLFVFVSCKMMTLFRIKLVLSS